MAEGFVYQFEHLLPVLLRSEHLAALQLRNVQVVALHAELGYALHLLGHALLGHIHLELHIVVVLLVALHLLHVLRIVGEVIARSHRSEFLEALGEHAFGIHVGEAQRTDDFLHALLAAPVFYGREQGPQHLLVVYKVEPAEAHAGAFPLGVVAMIDDARHTPHELSVAIGHEVLSLAEVEGRIAVLGEWTQRVQFVTIQIGGIVFVAPVQIVMKLNEGLKLPLIGHSSDFDC